MIAISTPIDADTLRIRHEFLVMPGMCLAVPQVARLFGVSLSHAARMLDLLEEEGFLIHTPDGQYRRAQPLMA
jgi:DNA-binding IclR family transcriptional regulator